MVTVPGHEVHNICKHILEVRGPEFVPLHHPQNEARDFHPLWSDFQPKITKYIFRLHITSSIVVRFSTYNGKI